MIMVPVVILTSLPLPFKVKTFVQVVLKDSR